MTKKIKKAPGWLGLSEDRTSFVYIPERADIVRQIFDLSIGGMGGYTIAKLLNTKGVPAFGTSKKWDQSTIHNMLSSRATIGEYQRKQTVDGKEYPAGDPVPGYYPPVIDENLFQAAQEARQRNLATGRGRKGRLITNLFAGLPSCFYCGSPVKFHSNGSAKSLICKAVLEGEECFRFGWSYGDFENSFFDSLNENQALPSFSEQLVRLQSGIQNQSHDEIYDARAEVARIVKANVLKLTIASAGISPPSSQRDELIRRNHPKRYFTAIFVDGSSRTGYPIVIPPARSTRKFNSVELSKSLRLSPHQGTLAALLAEGHSLTIAAEKLGVTLATARWHLREIFKRTGTHSQTELVSLAETTCPPEVS
jgi:DNA-binding CsgD family transcriptional regulator